MRSTEGIIEQGKALIRAIEALETIEATGPIEEVITWVLLKAYRRRLRAIVVGAPAWVSEEILSASQCIGDNRPVLWRSDN
ncbi:MAG: hypothetical protein U9R72_14495 [Chloroflexota bacterium]|nr:hypothetical protein [Chloroflexota bacterium]